MHFPFQTQAQVAMSEDAAPPPPTEAPPAEAAEGEEAAPAPAPAFAPPCMDLGEHIVKTDFFEVGSNAMTLIISRALNEGLRGYYNHGEGPY